MEGHGREVSVPAAGKQPDAELDLSQTVGWFTSYYPLVLSITDLDAQDVPDGDRLIRSIITSVKTRYRAVPNHGIGYGILRHLARDAELTKAENDAPFEILFNYLGQFNTDSLGDTAFPVSGEDAGPDIGPSLRREHRLGLNGEVRNGRLSFELDYSSVEYEADSVARFAASFGEALREIIRHCQSPGAGTLGPSDFPLADVDQQEVDRWLALHPALHDLYPAAGMQIGMIFHSRTPGEESVYTNQIYLALDEGFDPETFKAAWSHLIARHAVLRSAFIGMDRERPLQLVVSEAAPEWHEFDHRALDEKEAHEAFEAVRQGEMRRPFDFGRPPLIRFVLVREGRSRHRIIWTYHHCLLDGWSVSLLWRELEKTYRALRASDAPDLPAATPYAEYVRWRRDQDTASAREYWHRRLAGVEHPTRLGIEQEELAVDLAEHPRIRLQLDEAETQRLEKVARSRHVTVSTIVQAAWAYLLHLYSGDRDVVFGVTVSGRSIDLSSVESIVGLLINTVPARVTVDPTVSLGDWLRSLHLDHVERDANAHLDLIDIQRAVGARPGRPLFESILIFENYPRRSDPTEDRPVFSDYQYAEQTHYGLAVLAMPGARLTIDLEFDPSRFDKKDIAVMAEKLKKLLHNFSTSSEASVHSLSSPASEVAQVEWTPGASNAFASVVSRQGELRLGRYLVHQLFENHAEDTPEKLALVHDGRRYTYDQLNRMANRLANYLLANVDGIRADRLVGISLPRGDKLLISILAVWKAGAAYVPIDSMLPSPRVNAMLHGSEALLVISDADNATRHPFSEWGTRVLSFDEIVGDDRLSDLNPDVNVSGNDLSYVIYTSGSTGTPKGAMVEHIGMLNNIANKVIDFEIDAGSRVAQTASQSFDISVWQMFIALTRGATTVIYDDRLINDVDEFLRRLAADAITLVEMVPTYLVLVIERLGERAGGAPNLDLRFLVLTGETADAHFINRWFE
jgi:non-ribosomal peptide synthase protein (TIGR01720 family)